MPILRKQHQTKYTSISNEFLQNPNISLKAKGLLCYMLSCEDNWSFSIDGLAKMNKDGRVSVASALDELEELGYHKKERIYENGKIKEWIYYISEEPCFLDAENLHLENEANKKEQEEKETIVSKDTKKRKNLFQQCMEIIESTVTDEDVKERLSAYLSVRLKEKNVTAKSWKTIVDKLYDIADTKEMALKIIQQSIDKDYKSFYPVSQSYQKKDSYGARDTSTLEEDYITKAYHEWAESGRFFGFKEEFKELVEKGVINIESDCYNY